VTPTIVIEPNEDLERTTWTTDDEVEFIFELANKRKFRELEILRETNEKRDWSGEGMDVDPNRVRDMIDFILSRQGAELRGNPDILYV